MRGKLEPIEGKVFYHNTLNNDGKGWGFSYATSKELAEDFKSGTATLHITSPIRCTLLAYHGKFMGPFSLIT